MQGVDIRPDVLEHIKSQRNDSLFIKSLGVAVWGTEALADRSVTGRGSNRYGGRATKQALTPHKLRFVHGKLGRSLRQSVKHPVMLWVVILNPQHAGGPSFPLPISTIDVIFRLSL